MQKHEVSIPKIVMRKNRGTLVFISLTLLLVSNLYLSNTFSQDLGGSLPEGATARLGKGTIEEIRYSPDGTRLAAAGSFGIRLYDAQTGEELNLLIGHRGIVNSVSFSPDGRTLASAGRDTTIRLWDVRTGRHLRTLTRHTSWVRSVSFSPDGRTLASGSSDATIRLWDIRTGRHLRTLIGHTAGVRSVSFSWDGWRLASGSENGTVLLWETIPIAPAAPSQFLVALNKEVLINANSRPLETSLLANYPNPFNPETWMPYQLANPVEVCIVIYAADGQVIRKLDLGYQPAGFYESRSRAAYWDGKNAIGEPVASGVYFYTFTAGDFTATRRMSILK